MVEWIEIHPCSPPCVSQRVSTLVVEWIEISKDTFFKKLPDVSTLVVEWIEILAGMTQQQVAESPPSWWSGLKSNSYWYVPFPQVVSTLVVEWIEI